MNRYDSFLIIEKYHDTFEYLCYMIIKNQVLVSGTLRKRECLFLYSGKLHVSFKNMQFPSSTSLSTLVLQDLHLI